MSCPVKVLSVKVDVAIGSVTGVSNSAVEGLVKIIELVDTPEASGKSQTMLAVDAVEEAGATHLEVGRHEAEGIAVGISEHIIDIGIVAIDELAYAAGIDLAQVVIDTRIEAEQIDNELLPAIGNAGGVEVEAIGGAPVACRHTKVTLRYCRMAEHC